MFNIQRNLASKVAALVVGAFTFPLGAATINFANTAGGDFHTGGNWTGGITPGLADVAVFGSDPAFQANQPIAISFSANATNTQVIIQDAIHNFALNGNTYTVTSLTPVGSLGGDASVIIGAKRSADNANGNATLNLDGHMITQAGVLGLAAGQTGTLNVNGPNGFWDGFQFLDIGVHGTGFMNVTNGGFVISVNSALAGDASMASGGSVTSFGKAVVDGAGSTWYDVGTMHIGHTGTGVLEITNGGFVGAVFDAFVGFSPSATGSVMIDGFGSHFDVGSLLEVGSSGTGSVVVQNSGVLNAFDAHIGTTSGNGSVTVDGAGSQMNVSNTLRVGDNGTGVVTIQNGGFGTAAELSIGTNFTGVGTMTVTGPGSQFVSAGNATVGAFGSGVLNVLDGASFSAFNLTVGAAAGSNGVVNVKDSTVSITNMIDIGMAGTGLMVLDNAMIAASQVDVGANGTLKGSGTVDAPLVTNQGVVMPGTETTAGDLHLTGNFAQFNTGTLVLNVFGTDEADYSQLFVDDFALLLGNIVVNFLLDPHLLSTGDVFNLILYGGRLFDGVNIDINGLDGLTYLEIRGLDSYQIVITSQLPEPGSILLTGFGIGALVWIRRRRVRG